MFTVQKFVFMFTVSRFLIVTLKNDPISIENFLSAEIWHFQRLKIRLAPKFGH